MARNRNTDGRGSAFALSTISTVWQKGAVVTGWDPTDWRKDRCGAPIRRREYGNTNSSHGWEVDHNLPVAKGGSDDVANLQPLQWENNRHKGDDAPNWVCKVRG